MLNYKGFNLDNYVIKKNSHNDPQVWSVNNKKQIHGDAALTIFSGLEHQDQLLKKREHHLEWAALHQYGKINLEACKAICTHSNNNNSIKILGLLLNLLVNSVCSPKQKSDGINFYPPLYKINATFNKLRKKYSVGSNTIQVLFNALKVTHLAITHYGRILFSPILIYNKSISKTKVAIKYYKTLWVKYYGDKYPLFSDNHNKKNQWISLPHSLKFTINHIVITSLIILVVIFYFQLESLSRSVNPLASGW